MLLVGHIAVPDRELADDVLAIPKNEPELDPILLSVPLQLLAYHAAVALGQRRRPAAEPGQERHGRVSAAASRMAA